MKDSEIIVIKIQQKANFLYFNGVEFGSTSKKSENLESICCY